MAGVSMASQSKLFSEILGGYPYRVDSWMLEKLQEVLTDLIQNIDT